MEMLAMEMKAEGKYVARGLSYRDAEFSEIECLLDEAQTRMYNEAVALFKDLRGSLGEALIATGQPPSYQEMCMKRRPCAAVFEVLGSFFGLDNAFCDAIAARSSGWRLHHMDFLLLKAFLDLKFVSWLFSTKPLAHRC
eukprot:scaffold258039_cov19-Prasinocladus_malaysianus.AAC.1